MATILVGIPSYDGQISSRLSAALMNEARTPNVPGFSVVHKQVSLLAFGFNQLWCMALNNRHLFTHFLMLHADVVPKSNAFLDTLVKEMERTQADVLSVVMPLKDEKGLTSTALIPDLATAHELGSRKPRRRLALAEIEDLPETFDARDAVAGLNRSKHPFGDAGNPALLVNTGFMLVDLREPWIEQVHFTINDRVWKNADGKWGADVEPEDWYFSARAAAEGARVCATRCVQANHLGIMPFPNTGRWGSLEYDNVIDETLVPTAEEKNHEIAL